MSNAFCKSINIIAVIRFFISNTFISNVRLKLPKNEPNTKQHPEAELEQFQNYSHFSSTSSSNYHETYSQK